MNKSNFQGEVVKMISPVSDESAKDTFDYEDNFYPMDGFMEEAQGDKDDTFSQFDFGAIFGVDKAERQRRRKLREKQKQQELENQAKLAEALKSDTSSQMVAAALSSSAPQDEPTKPLSRNAKIGIGVGIAAVLGVALYYFTKKKK